MKRKKYREISGTTVFEIDNAISCSMCHYLCSDGIITYRSSYGLCGSSTKVGAEQRAIDCRALGTEQASATRFMAWFTAIIQGDWGISLIYRRPVLEVIGQKFLSSLALMGIAWVLSGLIGFVLGIAAGIKEGKLADK